MKLHEVITKAYTKKWSYSNNFFVQIKVEMFSTLSQYAFILMGEELNMHITSISLPDLQAQPIEEWQVDRYRFQLAQDLPYKLTISFIDSDDLILWRSFSEAYTRTKQSYFDNVKMEISIYKESDYDPDQPRTHLITYSEAIIESVSAVPFSNDSDQEIAKFTVSFKTQKYKLVE